MILFLYLLLKLYWLLLYDTELFERDLYENYVYGYFYPAGVEDEKEFIGDTEFALKNLLVWLNDYLYDNNVGATIKSLGFKVW